jgi:glycosyltransferase involved in cell wall biosynthesis
VAPVGERGGLEVVLLNTVKALDRSRVASRVAFLSPGPFVDEVKAAGAPVDVFEAGQVRNAVAGVRTVRALTRAIKRSRTDIVHSHNAKAHIYGGMAAALAGVPSVYHLHGVPRLSATRDGAVSLLSVLVPATRTVACSNWVAQDFRTAWRSARTVSVIHNGLDVQRSALGLEAASVRDEFGFAKDAPLVVLAARLQRWKGVHVFVEACAAIQRRCPEARMLVVGGSLFGLEEDYAVALRRQAERVGLAGTLVFTGFRDDVYRLLAAADVVAHASIHPDPFPTVVLEAMALGKPVVATDCGGPREMIDDRVTGILVAPGESAALAEAVVALLSDRVRCADMGTAAAARSARHFTVGHMTAKLERLYEDIHEGVLHARGR